MISGLVRSAARAALLVGGLVCGPLVGVAFANVTVPSAQYPTIQSAINAVLSGALPDGTTIDVQPGTYGEALIVASTSRSLTVRGTGGAGATIVDAIGKSAAAVNVFRATGSVTFSGLTFRRGSVGGTTSGGGFVVQESSPAFVSCVFEQNSAYNGGGGALITSNATFTGCTIRNNSARHFGGGVYIVSGSRPVFTACDIISNASGTGGSGGGGNDGAGGGVFSNDASPTFHGSHINANSSYFAAGGVFHMGVPNSPFGRSMLVMDDSEVNDNISSQFSGEPNPAEGGGIHVEDIATATLTRVRILRNRAGTGGGLNTYRGRYDVVDSVIDGNQASVGFGGGVSSSNNQATAQIPAAIINLTTTLVRNNTAPTGAGIAVVGDNFSSMRGTLTLTNSVVSGNQSQTQGGGVLANRTDLTVSGGLIINNTVSGGAAPFGGGVLVTTNASATFSGATMSHNTAGQLGGGVFINDNSTINMSGSRVYDNTAGSRGAALFVGSTVSGTVQNNTLADNTGSQAAGQINEDSCSSVTYPNNLITPTVSTGGCGTLSSRITGTNTSSPPRFATFLAVPSAGLSTTLAWSVARATSVTVAGVGTWSTPNNSPTGTADVTPATSTTFTLTATASGANGGNYGAVNAGFTSVAPPPPPAPRAVDGDFDGDRKSDIAVYRPSAGAWYLLLSSTQFNGGAGYSWGASGDVPVPGDYDGDGRIDVAVYRPSSGHWFILLSSTNYQTSATYQWGGAAGDIPVAADYDGDGRTDLAVYRPSNGTWYLRKSSTNFTGGEAYAWGANTDLPVPADFDGDGRADIVVYRPSSGHWFVLKSSAAYQASSTYQWGGAAGDVPVAGDYDGDGKVDPAVYRPSNGTWYILKSSTGYSAADAYAWGVSTDIPMPGDYDGDGRTDVVVYRSSTAHWFIRTSSSNYTVNLTYQWGTTGDVPLLK